MSHPEALSQWIETVSSMLPKLSRTPRQGAGLLELWDGAGQIVWHHAGVRGLSAASAEFGAEPAAALAGMVLWGQR
jgi:hypothetical protein